MSEHEQDSESESVETTCENSGVAENDTELTLEQRLAEAESGRDTNHERWIRAQAEMENLRKRTHRELLEMREYQSYALISDLLPALDNLDRAVAAAETSQNIDELLQGIRMVRQQFDSILGAHSATPISALGQTFDPTEHEAVQQVPSADHEPMTVLEVLQRGYTLKERVVRPSQVIVSCAAPDTSTARATDGEDSEKLPAAGDGPAEPPNV